MANILTIKNILKKIDINPIFFFLALVSVLTGLFKEFLVFTSIIIVHEAGHLLTALLLKWRVKKISIYPFGGYITFDEILNKPINEEFLIVISGVLMQTLYFIIIIFLYNNLYISDSLFIMFKHYHMSIFLFNLIPIYPLDGIKIVNLFLCKYFNYNLSHKISIIISTIFLVLFSYISIIYYLNMNMIMMISLLLNQIIKEKKNHNNLCSKFIFERYLYHLKFKKIRVIKNSKGDNLYRDYKHVFNKNGEYITEKKMLKNKFER